ncbi:MAG: biotin--[acetyl-CoA-carboxylase] ligase [Bacteroidia bacterium]|nr:biotin--[acetyl-CoA-carboxylase] ligase [Bacteroidia bacterium]
MISYFDNIIYIDELDSTNSYATNLLKHHKPKEGTVIITGNQKKGRGVHGNQWLFVQGYSFAGTWILYPDFLVLEKQYLLYVLATLSVYDFLAEKIDKNHNNLYIKWPNDIVLNSKKISGILIENHIKKNRIMSSVMGIGINMGPETKFKNFGTLGKEYCLKKSDLKEIASNISLNLMKYYDLLTKKKFDYLIDIYHNRLLNYHKNFEYLRNGKHQKEIGVNLGIDEFGRLKVKTGNEIYLFSDKEIVQIV